MDLFLPYVVVVDMAVVDMAVVHVAAGGYGGFCRLVLLDMMVLLWLILR